MNYKGYMIKVAPNSGHYEIHHTGKGSLPVFLTGLWTTAKAAQDKIDEYLNKKETK